MERCATGLVGGLEATVFLSQHSEFTKQCAGLKTEAYAQNSLRLVIENEGQFVFLKGLKGLNGLHSQL